MIEWRQSGALSCDECADVYHGEPPCDECEMPERFAANELAWKIWNVCSQYERPAGFCGIMPISAVRAAQMTEIFDGDMLDFEKVLFIESEMLPWIREEAKANSKAGKTKDAWD